MPNGVMTGDGSAESPYVVMDGYDFNELRNISTSSSSFKYLEIGADIDLSMYASFVPIPVKHFNIAGNSHSITNFYIAAAASGGLFAELHTNSVTDLVIEGEVMATSTSTYSQAVAGLFAANLVGRGGVVSNVQCFGTVTSGACGGLAGQIGDDSYTASNITGATTTVQNCAFQGTLNFTPTGNVSTALNASTPYAGGLIGQLYVTSYRNSFIIKNCLVKANIVLTTNAGHTLTGGIFASTYYGGTAYTNSVIECVAVITFIINGTGSASYQAYYGGLFGYGVQYQSDSQINGFVAQNSTAHTDIVLNGNYNVNAGGLAHRQYSTAVYSRSSLASCYAVISLAANGNSIDNVQIDGISRFTGYSVSNCFFDREVLEATYTKYAGAYIYPGTNLATADLKSADFLASKGWDI